MKQCTKCAEEKPLAQFHKHGSGLRAQCKICVRARNLERYHAFLKNDPASKAQRRKYSMEWHKDNKERANKRVASDHKAQRLTCLAHYGKICACCGESRYEFLSIDHTHGGGSRHRKSGVSKICRWLIKNGFPDGFRVLCHNCNQAIGHYGICPHVKQITAVVSLEPQAQTASHQ